MFLFSALESKGGEIEKEKERERERRFWCVWLIGKFLRAAKKKVFIERGKDSEGRYFWAVRERDGEWQQEWSGSATGAAGDEERNTEPQGDC